MVFSWVPSLYIHGIFMGTNPRKFMVFSLCLHAWYFIYHEINFMAFSWDVCSIGIFMAFSLTLSAHAQRVTVVVESVCLYRLTEAAAEF